MGSLALLARELGFVVSGCDEITKGLDFKSLAAERDRKIVEIIKIQKNHVS